MERTASMSRNGELEMDPTARFTTGLLVHAKLDSDSNVAVSRTAPTRQTEIAALIQVAMQRLLEAMSLDAIIVDAEMNVLFANDLAQRTLREADVVTVTHGRLRPADPSRGRALYGLIARMVDGGTAATECIALLRPSGNPLYILGRAIGGGISARPNRVLLLIRDSGLKPELATDDFGRLYKLTPAETRLLDAILHGRSLKDYSVAARVTYNTARTQLQSVFQKTGFGRQAELVSAMLGDPLLHLATLRSTS